MMPQCDPLSPGFFTIVHLLLHLWAADTCSTMLRNGLYGGSSLSTVFFQNHQKTNNTIPRHSLTENVNYFHFGRNELRCHETTIIYTFGQSFFNKTFNNTICMRTHNQLHYYTIISMKVTVFSAVRQTLQS